MSDLAELPTEEILKDRADNERDIKMFQLMIEGHWDSVHQPRMYLTECLRMKIVIDKELERRGVKP